MNGNSSHAKLRKPPYFVPEENLIAIRSSVMSVLFQKISIPPPPPSSCNGGQRKFRGEGGSKRWQFPSGCGWPLESFFRGLRVRLMSKLSVILLLIGVSKQRVLFFSMIFYLRSTECFFLMVFNVMSVVMF